MKYSLHCQWVICILLAGCVAVPDKPPPTEVVTFVDTVVFDQELASAMSAGMETITVNLLTSSSINEIPSRLGHWLNVIADKGGRVALEPKTQKSLTVLLGLFSLLPPAYHFLRQEIKYGVAGDYNATIHYLPESGAVKKIVFFKKSA
jgi:hypothetical protein